MDILLECRSLVLIKSELVKLVFSQTGTTAFELSGIIAQLLDGFHLLSQEIPFNIVHHLKTN